MTVISGVTDNSGKKIDITAGEITAQTNLAALADALGLADTFLHDLLNGVNISGTNISLEKLLDKAVTKNPTSVDEVKKLLEKGEKLQSELEALKGQKEQLETKKAELAGKNDTQSKKQLASVESSLTAIKALEAELKEAQARLGNVLNSSFMNNQEDLKKQIQKFIGTQDAAKGDTDNSTSSVSSPLTQSTGKAFTPGGVYESPQSGAPAGKGQSYAPYGDFSGKGLGGGEGISLAMGADDSVLQLYDIVGEQKKRQHMMTLFFYYARMAMSGDIGAMYQFMRFIGYVIARDKALQNVWMGTKLIELQETSRKATQRLLNTKVGESAAEQAEWQKELQKIKSEEGIVASSQKLISQMMEEFTQVVEILTNIQKSLLDVNGKVNSNLSVWR